METRQVPKNEWSAFLNSFSSRHQGWQVNVEVFGPEIGAQVEGTCLMLQGLTEWHDGKGNMIAIMIGNKSDDHVTHSIIRPTEISLEKTDSGDDAVLSIKGEDGVRTLLTLPAAVY